MMGPVVFPVGEALKTAPMPVGQKLLAQTLRMAESPMGLSHTVAAQHILMSWLPKAVFSRSKAEIVELTILDVIETFLVYYAIPLTAGLMFFPALRHLTKGKSGAMADLAKPVQVLVRDLKDTNPAKLRRLLSTKAAAVLMGMVAGGAVWEYALTFFKNAITLKAFKKDSFSSIANLSKEKTVDTENSRVMKRAKQRIATALGIGAATVVLGGLLGTVGHNAKWLQPGLERFLKVFDFRYGINPKTGKHVVGLSDNLNRFFIANAFVAYIDSARDGLERFEIISRLSVVLSYLAFGNGIVDRLSTRYFSRGNTGKTMQNLFKQQLDVYGKPLFDKKGNPKLEIKKLHELFEDFYKEELQEASWKAFAQKCSLNDQSINRGSVVRLKESEHMGTRNPAVRQLISDFDNGIKPAFEQWSFVGREFISNKARKIIFPTQAELKNIARKRLLTALPAKLKMFFVPQVIGVAIAGFANAGVNRLWTAYRFKEAEKQKAALNHFMPTDLHLRTVNRGFDDYFNRLQQVKQSRLLYN